MFLKGDFDCFLSRKKPAAYLSVAPSFFDDDSLLDAFCSSIIFIPARRDLLAKCPIHTRDNHALLIIIHNENNGSVLHGRGR